jgi:hypothetical protein
MELLPLRERRLRDCPNLNASLIVFFFSRSDGFLLLGSTLPFTLLTLPRNNIKVASSPRIRRGKRDFL